MKKLVNFSLLAAGVAAGCLGANLASAWGQGGHKGAARLAIQNMESYGSAHYARQAIDKLRNKLTVWYSGDSGPQWESAKNSLISSAYEFDNLKTIYLCDTRLGDPEGGYGYEGDCEYYNETLKWLMDIGTNYGRYTHFINMRNPGQGYNWGEYYGGYNYATHRPHNGKGDDGDKKAAWNVGGVGETFLKRSSYDNDIYRITNVYGDAVTKLNGGTTDKELYYAENFTQYESMVFPPLDSTMARWFNAFVAQVNKIDFSRRDWRPDYSAWELGTCPFTGRMENVTNARGQVGYCSSGTWRDYNVEAKTTAQRYLGYVLHATDAAVAHHVHNTMSSDHNGFEDAVDKNIDTLYDKSWVEYYLGQLGTDGWLSHCKYSDWSSKNQRSNGVKDVIELVASKTFEQEWAFDTQYNWGNASTPGSTEWNLVKTPANRAVGLAQQLLVHGAMYIAYKDGDSNLMWDMCN